MRRTWIILSLIACGPPAYDGVLAPIPPTDTEPALLDAAPPPNGGWLQASDLPPARNMNVQVRNFPINAGGFLLRGAPGGQSCPPALGGGCVDLGNATVIDRFTTDPWGIAHLNVPVPRAIAPQPFSFQAFAAVPGAAVLSNIETRAVVPPGGEWAMGNVRDLGLSGAVQPGYLLGHAIRVSDNVEVEAFTVRSVGAGQRARLALYEDAGGRPGALVTHTGIFTVVPGLDREPAVNRRRIRPGTYWVMAIYDQQANIHYTTTTGATVAYTLHGIGLPLPDPFPLPATYTGQELNYAILVE
jgi:hypothetical protein